ncbi:hypothetical protein B0H13DRAFT_1894337 [Mycena leptocephala]|nr:hypothetical protein B0H13DRAFT_1894337 [Mycena leptocephala]
MDVDSTADPLGNDPAGSEAPMDIETPSTFHIKRIPHPHNNSAAPSLDGGIPPGGVSGGPSLPFAPRPTPKPWAAFRTRAEFDYTESVFQLAGIGGEWSNSPSNITFRNYNHMGKSLAVVRTYGVQFQTGEVEAEFEGTTYKFEFQYRDLWEWIVDLLSDPSLADEIQCPLVPRAKDEIVTNRVRKYLIVLRALFLNGKNCNASGTGGGVLIGYMVIPLDPGDPADRKKTQNAIDWARFKREVMHKVFQIIFGPLLGPGKHGEALTCGDSIQRVCYPGIPVTFIDGEEAYSVSACCAALAKCPCPRCLVQHTDLAKINKSFTLRTTETVREKYEQTLTAPKKTQSERILQSVGLHPTENFCWSLPNGLNCDLYSANSMRDVPRWRNLKHFPNVTTDEYTDGQTFLDILKFIAFATISSNVSQLVWNASPRIKFPSGCATMKQCMRARSENLGVARWSKMSQIQRERIGEEEKRRRMEKEEEESNRENSAVNGELYPHSVSVVDQTPSPPCDFVFYKQHACTHVNDDIRNKGVPAGYSTHPGEGNLFSLHTRILMLTHNLVQLARIDENKEAFAHIRMAIEDYDAAVNSLDGEECEDFVREESELHWSFGSPLTLTTVETLQQQMKDTSFCADLRRLLNEFMVDLALQAHDVIKIKCHRCVRLRYQSCVNWMEETDILRCNPEFHGQCKGYVRRRHPAHP